VPGEEYGYPASTMIPRSQLKAVMIVTVKGKTLVTVKLPKV
jgi:hypothetical protein